MEAASGKGFIFHKFLIRTPARRQVALLENCGMPGLAIIHFSMNMWGAQNIYVWSLIPTQYVFLP